MRHTAQQPFGITGTLVEGEGFRVDHVGAGSPADRAGLQAGDYITHVHGYPVSFARLYEALADGGFVGLLVPLVVRDGNTRTLQTILADLR